MYLRLRFFSLLLFLFLTGCSLDRKTAPPGTLPPTGNFSTPSFSVNKILVLNSLSEDFSIVDGLKSTPQATNAIRMHPTDQFGKYPCSGAIDIQDFNGHLYVTCSL